MAGSIDDIDHVIPVSERTVLGGYGYAAFPLQVHGVHEPFGHGLVVAKHAALLKQLVNKGGFAMIDMGYNRYVSNKFFIHNFTVNRERLPHNILFILYNPYCKHIP